MSNYICLTRSKLIYLICYLLNLELVTAHHFAMSTENCSINPKMIKMCPRYIYYLLHPSCYCCVASLLIFSKVLSDPKMTFMHMLLRHHSPKLLSVLHSKQQFKSCRSIFRSGSNDLDM